MHQAIKHRFFVATFVAIIMASVMITLGWASGTRDTGSGTPATKPPVTLTPTGGDATSSPFTATSAKSKGLTGAPIAMIVYSDFQCSHCQEFALNIERRLESTYVDIGKVFLVYKHAIAFGDESQLAAEASEAAAEQGQFWPYHDLLMQLRASPKDGDLPISKLQQLAQQVGLNMDLFNASLQSGKFREKVKQENAESEAVGVRAVPTFYINGIRKDGLRSFEELQAILDELIWRR